MTIELTHILFVDDVLLLGEGTMENMQSLAQFLSLYKKATWMLINMDKSSLVLSILPKYFQQRIMTEIEFHLRPLDEGLKYMGFSSIPMHIHSRAGHRFTRR